MNLKILILRTNPGTLGIIVMGKSPILKILPLANLLK